MNVAIIEDEPQEAALIKRFLERYSTETGERFEATAYGNAEAFLENYRPRFDIVFMDIELPGMNGIDASRRLRTLDSTVVLIFVTNMSQFAVCGYEVNAMDFVVKPISYGNFSLKLRRAAERVRENNKRRVAVYTPDGTRLIPVDSVKYVEVMDHKVVWHTTAGEFELCGSLKKIETELPKPDFVRCNNCYIVNLKYVETVKADSVIVDGKELAVSRMRRKELMQATAEFLEVRF